MMREQMERSVFVPPLHGISDIGLEYVDKLGQTTPGNAFFGYPEENVHFAHGHTWGGNP